MTGGVRIAAVAFPNCGSVSLSPPVDRVGDQEGGRLQNLHLDHHRKHFGGPATVSPAQPCIMEGKHDVTQHRLHDASSQMGLI